MSPQPADPGPGSMPVDMMAWQELLHKRLKEYEFLLELAVAEADSGPIIDLTCDSMGQPAQLATAKAVLPVPALKHVAGRPSSTAAAPNSTAPAAVLGQPQSLIPAVCLGDELARALAQHQAPPTPRLGTPAAGQQATMPYPNQQPCTPFTPILAITPDPSPEPADSHSLSCPRQRSSPADVHQLFKSTANRTHLLAEQSKSLNQQHLSNMTQNDQYQAALRRRTTTTPRTTASPMVSAREPRIPRLSLPDSAVGATLRSSLCFTLPMPPDATNFDNPLFATRSDYPGSLAASPLPTRPTSNITDPPLSLPHDIVSCQGLVSGPLSLRLTGEATARPSPTTSPSQHPHQVDQSPALLDLPTIAVAQSSTSEQQQTRPPATRPAIPSLRISPPTTAEQQQAPRGTRGGSRERHDVVRDAPGLSTHVFALGLTVEEDAPTPSACRGATRGPMGRVPALCLTKVVMPAHVPAPRESDGGSDDVNGRAARDQMTQM